MGENCWRWVKYYRRSEKFHIVKEKDMCSRASNHKSKLDYNYRQN